MLQSHSSSLKANSRLLRSGGWPNELRQNGHNGTVGRAVGRVGQRLENQRIPDLDWIERTGRRVIIAFGADVRTKESYGLLASSWPGILGAAEPWSASWNGTLQRCCKPSPGDCSHFDRRRAAACSRAEKVCSALSACSTVALTPPPWGGSSGTACTDHEDRLTTDWLQRHGIPVSVEIAGAEAGNPFAQLGSSRTLRTLSCIHVVSQSMQFVPPLKGSQTDKPQQLPTYPFVNRTKA